MTKKILSLAFILLCFVTITKAQNNVGVNTTTPDPSAALDVQSTTQGMLIPRMTASQRGLIASPATGLLIYQSDAPAGSYFSDGSVWSLLGAAGPAGANGQGVPAGGTANQVLKKIDATDYNTHWVTSPTPPPTVGVKYYICVGGMFPMPGNIGFETFTLGSIQMHVINYSSGNGGSWEPCNGQLLSIAQNSALFSLIGTTYGGNGTTNFALPNLNPSGSVPAGY